MTEYQENDMVVAKIDHVDAMDLSDDENVTFHSNQILGKLKDFQQSEEKIQMTADEKEEFDELKQSQKSLFLALDEIVFGRCPNLYDRLFGDIDEGHCKAQVEFSRAWGKPSLIEVIKPEHEFKVGDLVKYKATGVKGVVNIVGDSVVKMVDQDGSTLHPLKKDLVFIKSHAIDWGE